MKKIILSMVVIGTILSTQALASDTTSLTRATAKLIKNQHSIMTQTNTISELSHVNSEELIKQNSLIEDAKKNLANTDSKVNANKLQIDQLFIKSNEAIVAATSATKTANDTRSLVNEMRGISDSFKNESNEVVNSAKVAYEKSTIAEDKVAVLATATTMNSNQLQENVIKIQFLESELIIVKNSLSADQQKIEELESKIESMKIYFTAEIKILKAKFDRARPVYIIDNESDKNCPNGKCDKTDNSAENIIDSYLE